MANKSNKNRIKSSKPADRVGQLTYLGEKQTNKPLRIVIDMQGAQTESRFRGIGRYTMSFAQGIVRNRGEHEVLLALSGLFPETIEPIRAAFDGLLPQENIRVWYAPGPVSEEQPGNEARRQVAELIHEAFLASLQPDVIHITSLFEGYVDNAVTSIGRFDTRTPISVSLYDLIPLINPEHYLTNNPRYADYYLRKVDWLNQATCYLAISDFTKQEGEQYLSSHGKRIANVSTAIDARFRPEQIDAATHDALFQKFNLTRPFILYTGGADERKNLPRLIQAYNSLPDWLRQNHQLIFAGKMPQGKVEQFQQIARAAGLNKDELIFTGYVSDEELIQLYNLCKLYVFPSWHEGFGLPALEAMACGAPVIGANTSSLPEVIGLDEALFDPMEVRSIAAKLQQALTDGAFLSRLLKHSLHRAKYFSWDVTAKRAFATWEALSPAIKPSYLESSTAHAKLIAACTPHAVSDHGGLQRLATSLAINQQAGIERQLLLDVSELSQRDAATGVQRVVRSYLKGLLQSPPRGFRVEPVYATRENGYRYARQYTQRFLGNDAAGVVDDPMGWQRGDIFFGLDMQHHVQLAHEGFYSQLRQDGVTVKFLVYDLLPIQLTEYFKDSDASELHARWLAMIARMDGTISISKATAEALGEWIASQGLPTEAHSQNDWVHIGADIEGSQPSQGLPVDAANVLLLMQSRVTFLCVATLEPRKGQQQILQAFEKLWQQDIDVNIVLVGQQGWKIEALAERIQSHPENGHRLFWLEGISDEYLEKVYAASTCLIAASINEGFGLPVIEAASHGIPVVARGIPVFHEVAGNSAYYFFGEKPEDLAQALQQWLELYRAGKHPDSRQMRWSTWQAATEKLKNALVVNYPHRQLLVDISELVQRDAKTGIQRVVRSVLKEWLTRPPVGWRIEPVYATVEQPYRYARQFTAQFMGHTLTDLTDENIDYATGDVFFALDLQTQVQVAKATFYQELRRGGVKVKFLVYDLLCVQMPEYFVPGSAEGFRNWLNVVGESDGAISISRATAQALEQWMRTRAWQRLRQFQSDWSHIGADVKGSAPSTGLPSNAEEVLNQMRARKSFLMVGTLEPRKGQTQVLDAFDRLWDKACDVNLVIVGKQGWMVDQLVGRLREHPELHKRLFWLEGISDEYLEKVYAASTCLIAASYGEGFGLPLVEAAKHNLPIIARNIPVFREVADKHAYYFDAITPGQLAESIESWVKLYYRGESPNSDKLPWLGWSDSVVRLNEILLTT